MVKILSNKDLEDIMNEVSTPAYFFQKEKDKEREDFQHLYEDDGSVILEFVTGIVRVEPDTLDSIGRKWNGGTQDKDGNPVLDKNTGKVRDAWDKFEAKTIIKEKELVYGFGGQRGALFREFINALKREKLSNEKLVGTKWKITCNNIKNYDWSVELITQYKTMIEGTEPIETKRPVIKKEPPKEISKPNDEYKKVVNAVQEIKEKNKGRTLAGLTESELIEPTSFLSGVNSKKITGYLKELEENGVIKISGGKVYIQ